MKLLTCILLLVPSLALAEANTKEPEVIVPPQARINCGEVTCCQAETKYKRSYSARPMPTKRRVHEVEYTVVLTTPACAVVD